MRRQELQEEREAREIAEAADRGRALSEQQTAADELTAEQEAFSEQILSGAADKTKAGEEWGARVKERMGAALQNVPERYRQDVQRGIESRAAALSRGVRRAVTQRNQQETRASLLSSVEAAGRQYLKDPTGADQVVQASLASLGPASGLDPVQLQAIGQRYKEESRYTLGFTLLNAAKSDNKALAAVEAKLSGGEFEAMDPQRKAQLLTTLEGYRSNNIQRAEIEARRREAQQEAAMRRAEAEFNGAQSLLAQGKVLRPEYIESVSKATAGTPYQAAFRESLKPDPERVAFGAQPLDTQRQALLQMRGRLNASGTDQKTEKRVAELERMHAQAVSEYAADPLPAALERGIITELAPIATNDVASLVQTMGQRIQQAQLVRQQVGRPVSPLVQREAESVAQMLDILPVKQRATALAQIAQVAGPEVSQALALQIAGKNRALGLALAAGSAKTTAGRLTSELILSGAQALKDKTAAPDTTKDSNWRREIAAEIGDAYVNDQQREAAIEAAYFIRAGLDAEGGGSNRQAVKLATGGIVTRAGRKVPLPYGLDADQFDRKLREVTPASLGVVTVYIDGKPMPAAQFIDALQAAPLVSGGKGRYAIPAGRSFVTRDAEGRVPLYVEVR
jgi:hypothetical protein